MNIGAAINTPNWDTYLTISAVDKRTYYISNPEDRNTSTDIFQIKLPDSLLPEPVILLKGHVYEDESTIPLGSRISVREIETNKEVAYTTSDPKTGRFQLVLPKGKRYTFYAAKDRMFSIRENLDVTAIDSSIIIEKNLYLAFIQPGERIKLNNLFFERGRSNILPISLPELDNLVKILKRKQDLTIRIEGHTDNLGSKSLNLRLSELRAEKVKAYLIEKGIHKKRLKTKGYGGTLPVADNRNPITRKLNRRVEFFILE